MHLFKRPCDQDVPAKRYVERRRDPPSLSPAPRRPSRAAGRRGHAQVNPSCRMDTSVAMDEFVETAGAAAARLVLVQERQVILVEDLEELVPRDLLELFLGLAEVDAEDATVAAVLDASRVAVARLGPFADLVMLGGGVGVA